MIYILSKKKNTVIRIYGENMQTLNGSITVFSPPFILMLKCPD